MDSKSCFYCDRCRITCDHGKFGFICEKEWTPVKHTASCDDWKPRRQ